MVIKMSRLEKKKTQKKSKLNKLKRCIAGIISIVFLIILLYMGLITVDRSNRTMILLDQQELLTYNKIDLYDYEVMFCGERYSLDTEQIANTLHYINNKAKVGFKNVKDILDETNRSINYLVKTMLTNKAES